jgi:hypothetical protein
MNNKLRKNKWMLNFLLLCISVCGVTTQTLHALILNNDIEKQVLDPCHISFEEYKNIENHFRSIRSEDLPPLITRRCIFFFNAIKFVGNKPSEVPIFETLYINNNPNDKKNCIVLYASYNSPYPENISKIISALKRIEFDGHVVYRIGGYPNLEEGSLKIMDVPYAFKVCAMREASRLGYQNILWIDCSLTPVKNLQSLFAIIESRGYFAMTSGSTVREEVEKGYINYQALAAMGFSNTDSLLVPHITTPIFGLNLHSSIGKEILQRFYRMAEEKAAFFCDWPDEAPVSAILYQMKLKPLGKWDQYMVKDWEWDGKGASHYFSMSLARPVGRE